MTKEKRNLNYGLIFTAVTGFSAVCLAGLICFYLKDEILGCHDSFYDFIYARTHGFADWYRTNLEFNLSRGRAGFIFSLVSTFRFRILSTGNYTAIWLLQQIPIWFTVGLLAFVTGRRTRPLYGFLFVSVYCIFLQIDDNHNIMTCYPLDFMYGMSLMILGLCAYDRYLSSSSRKGNLKWLVISVFLYYESMTEYEPFLTACFIYALIALVHVLKRRGEYKKRSFWIFVKSLIPHAATAVFFFVLLRVIKILYAAKAVDVTPVDSYGTMTGFLKTWRTFSTSLFPLSNSDMVDMKTAFHMILAGKFIPAFCICAALSVISAIPAARYVYRPLSREEKRKLNGTLIVIGIAGLLYAVFFTVPHAMTDNYQMWVEQLGAQGYLTSSLCYFGWALMCSCILSVIINLISDLRVPFTVILAAGLSVLIFTGALVTVSINNIFRSADTLTGSVMSRRGQTFYSFFTSDYAKENAAQLIYLNGFIGIHRNILIDDYYADCELGKDVILISDLDYFRNESRNFDSAGMLVFDPGSEAGWYVSLDNPGEEKGKWTTDRDIVFVSSAPGIYEFEFDGDGDGETEIRRIDASRMDVYEIGNEETLNLATVSVGEG